MTYWDYDNKRVHNFSLGTLSTYYKLNEIIPKHKVKEHEGFFFIDRGAAKSTMVFDSTLAEKNKDILLQYQKLGPIYSIDPISIPFPNKFIEILYDLDVVFDKASYSNSKKRHKKIVYPFKFVDKHNYVIELIETVSDFARVKILHDKWVEYKLANPKVFKIMFPTGRYINCVKQVDYYKNKNVGGFFDVYVPTFPVKYCVCIVKFDDNILAVRVVSIQDDTGYDLAFFGAVWDMPSQMMNYLDIVLLKKIKEKYGIKYFNCGAASSKGLNVFKSHIPSTELISWRYKKDTSND